MIPRLAGQPMGYMIAQLKAYLDPSRKLPNEVMRTVLRGLSPTDLDALAHFYAAAPEIPPAHTEDIHVIAPGCDNCHHPGFPDMALIGGQAKNTCGRSCCNKRGTAPYLPGDEELLTAYSEGPSAIWPGTTPGPNGRRRRRRRMPSW
jgi:hypothetical protein